MVSHKTNQDSKQKAQQREQREQREKRENDDDNKSTQQKIVTMVQKMVHNPRVLTWLFKTMPAVKKIKS
jgi:hypothetical protein